MIHRHRFTIITHYEQRNSAATTAGKFYETSGDAGGYVAAVAFFATH